MPQCLTTVHCWNEMVSGYSWLETVPAVMPFPWVTLPKGRAFVEEVIRPRHLLVHHLPLPEDDLYGYRPATEAALSKVQVQSVWLMDRAFREIIIE